MKTILVALIVVLALLQYKFWIGPDSIVTVWELRKTIRTQEQELNTLKLRNQTLSLKIESLKKYPAAIEEQARYELGMVKEGEKYYQVVEPIE